MSRVADIIGNVFFWIGLTSWIGGVLLELLRADWDMTEIPWSRVAVAFALAGCAAALFLREVLRRDD